MPPFLQILFSMLIILESDPAPRFEAPNRNSRAVDGCNGLILVPIGHIQKLPMQVVHLLLLAYLNNTFKLKPERA